MASHAATANASAASPTPNIGIIGACTHNLQNISAEIPLGQFTVVTGVSGSGKSSLVYDTLFAEGRSRYLQCVSRAGRHSLTRWQRPDVEDITNLPPTLAIEQRAPRQSRRSTLASVTEIGDFLQVLFARAGLLHCPRCQSIVRSQSRQSVVERVLAYPEQAKIMILAPVVRGKTGRHEALFPKIAARGFVRARVDGEIIDLQEPPLLEPRRRHDIEVVVDRLIVREGIADRLQESLAQAFDLGEGTAIVSRQPRGEAGWTDELFSIVLACQTCGTSYPPLQPNTFSFHSPFGACPACEGMGFVNEEPDTDAGDAAPQPCTVCNGTRLGELARHTTFHGLTFPGFTAKTVTEALSVAAGWANAISEANDDQTDPATEVARRLVPEIGSRLDSLQQIGLGYLTLDRPAHTLSAGEFQRARLAAALGLGLAEACYVLDEPTIGLHPRDTDRLLKMLLALRDQGSTVVAVEHDLDIVRAADYVLDLGPGAGRLGGEVIAAGPPEELAGSPASVTGRYLRREASAAKQSAKSRPDAPIITFSGVTCRHLHDLTVGIPQQRLVAVTGVSGSGKSTLVLDVLVPALRAHLAGRPLPATLTEIRGIEPIERVKSIDQALPGKSRRGNPATFSGVWTMARRLFAKTREARILGFTTRDFSFNSPAGRCPECRGLGVKVLQMKLLPSLEIPCDACHGTRFRPEIRNIRFRGRSVDEILSMTFREAAEFFEPVARIYEPLRLLCDVGVDYLTLGQSLTTLSGGEVQRLKLGTELATTSPAPTLFVLDEPTTGLHPADITRLLTVFERLLAAGHTVLVIEHQLDVVAASDWVIDLGPESGADGGRILFTGPPSELARQDSATGRAFAAHQRN